MLCFQECGWRGTTLQGTWQLLIARVK